MNKIKQFNAKASYALPSVKIVAMRTNRNILTVSNPWNNDGSRNLDEEDVTTQDGWFIN